MVTDFVVNHQVLPKQLNKDYKVFKNCHPKIFLYSYPCFLSCKEENPIDPEIAEKINIGFPKIRKPRSVELKERLAHLKAQRSSPQLEKIARRNNCKLLFVLRRE